MTGPWEDFAAVPADGPWADFAAPKRPALADAANASATGNNVSPTTDAARSLPRGMLTGATDAVEMLGKAMLPVPLSPWALTSAAKTFSQITGVGKPATDRLPAFPESAAMRDLVEKNVTGELPKPAGPAGRYSAAIGETLGNPISYVGPGSLPMKVLTGATAATGAEFAGDAFKGSRFEPIARLMGALLGGNAPRTASRFVTPLPAAGERLAAATTLKNEGVDITAGQLTGRPWLKYWENDLSPGLNEKQAEQFTNAALRRVGESAPRATPEVVDGAFTRIGKSFDDASAANKLVADKKLATDFGAAWKDYASKVPESMRAPVVGDTIQEVAHAIRNNKGVIQGDVYQSLRSRLSRMARGTNDTELSHALSDMTEALDDAMARSIRQFNPGDTGKFEQARRQYRNMLVIERAAAAPGESAALGLLTPAQLSSAAKAIMGKRAYVRGKGDFAPLVRAGQADMLVLPDSGTSQRNRINNLLRLGGGAMGAVIGPHTGTTDPIFGLLLGELAAEPLARGGAKQLLMNRATQGYLKNQLLPDVPGLLSVAPGQLLTAGVR